MAIDRPTFHESWFRVSSLKPELRPRVQIFRQHYRGQTWHVVQDPSSNQYYRLSDPAYRFIAMLDGRRNVADAWRVVNEQIGDAAPTQGEVIQLLGQLYTSNLLRADLPPDAEGLFQRYQKRTGREVRGYMTNLLFLRLPLYDPESFLNRWVGVLGKVFSWSALVVWSVLVATALFFVVGNWEQLKSQGGNILDLNNLPYLYLGMVLIKLFHEFGHAFACKKFGRKEGVISEVHTMGIMLLVFMPVPYVDASSAWSFRSRWHRAAVGLAGMYVELAVAAVAAIVWANIAPGDLRTILFNVMFIASVSSVVFNGNPLLRYDAYYVLSDLIETPNLSQRSKNYLYYAVRKYAFGARKAVSPAQTRGERVWFGAYGVASTVFRIWISVRILMFVADKLFFVGMFMAILALAGWVLVPIGKFLHYLLTSGELARTRNRAMGVTGAAVAALLLLVGVIPLDDHVRGEGVVEPRRMVYLHAPADGKVMEVLPAGSEVAPPGDPDDDESPNLYLIQNRQIKYQRYRLYYTLGALRKERQEKVATSPGQAAALAKRIEHVEAEIRALGEDLQQLRGQASFPGQWIDSNLRKRDGLYVRTGDPLGVVVDMDSLYVRAVAGQEIAAILIDEIYHQGNAEARKVQLRVKGRPDLQLAGRIEKIAPSGTLDLPSKALGYQAGGSVATAEDDEDATKAAERFFEVVIALDHHPDVRLLSGMRVVVRFTLSPKPLAAQWYRSVRQLVLKRFRL
jgi:putative peptide zinc metalloprotease protein